MLGSIKYNEGTSATTCKKNIQKGTYDDIFYTCNISKQGQLRIFVWNLEANSILSVFGKKN